MAVFAGSLAGGLLNACAPGNFVRNNGTAGTAQILQAIALSAEHVVHRGYYLLKYTPFLAVIAVVFLYMLKYVKLENRSIRLYHLGLLAVLIVAGGTAVAFPVMLGHGENYYPDRCLFIDDCLIYIGTFLFLLLLPSGAGMWEEIKEPFCTDLLRQECLCGGSLLGEHSGRHGKHADCEMYKRNSGRYRTEVFFLLGFGSA